MVDLNELARKRGLFIDNAATASQNEALIDDGVTREAIELNVIAPLIVEISERDQRIAALEAQLAEKEAENERLLELFKTQSDAHAKHVKGLLAQHAAERDIYGKAAQDFRERAEHTEAQRDEALKALDEADAIIEEMVAAENEWQSNPADDERIASVQSRASVYLAARRVREGGRYD